VIFNREIREIHKNRRGQFCRKERKERREQAGDLTTDKTGWTQMKRETARPSGPLATARPRVMYMLYANTIN
jgi:hypothetical protein